MSRRSSDPMPLSARQLAALAAAATRELVWVRPRLDRELRQRQRLAARIPDAEIRADALRSFSAKRGHITGAALFATLPRRCDDDLLGALIAFEMIVDFLDDAHERHPTEANGLQLHLAVTDAFQPGAPTADYYARHPWRRDGGYLLSLVETCRARCRSLPSFAIVQPLLAREAARAREALTLNHLPRAGERDRALREWTEAEFPGESEWRWYELTAAASGQLAIFALLAQAAKPDLDAAELVATCEAYWPLVPLLTNMLDSFADQEEDLAGGKHRYLAHYPEADGGAERLVELIGRAGATLTALPDGHRHAIVFACMVAFYLAKDSAREPAREAQAKRLVRAGGSLPQALAPILRIWRRAYSQRTA